MTGPVIRVLVVVLWLAWFMFVGPMLHAAPAVPDPVLPPGPLPSVFSPSPGVPQP
jgi:hypothetical protein